VTSSSSTSFTASDGRKFAFPVGGAFGVLCAVLFWREKAVLAWVFCGVAATLLVAGLAVPARLGPLYRAWMRMAAAISKVTTPIFMGVVYFLVLTPTGLVMRLFGRSPIAHRRVNDSRWHSRAEGKTGDLNRQF